MFAVACSDRVVFDAQLKHDLVQALAPGPEKYDEAYPSNGFIIVPGEITLESFKAKTRGVPGWDLIAVVGPYNSGAEISGDPLLAGHDAALRRSISEIEGFPNDGTYDIEVIRADRIVAQFWLKMEGSLPGGSVIARGS